MLVHGPKRVQGNCQRRSATRRRLLGAPWCTKIRRRLLLPFLRGRADTGRVRRGRWCERRGRWKFLPGRKSDVADATWLAQLGARGLVRGSFVPPEPVRQLRDLTRARTAITRERGREVQRLEKLLEDGIKLSAVASDILCPG